MLEKYSIEAPKGLRAMMNAAYHVQELRSVTALIEQATLTPAQLEATRLLATRLVQQVRLARKKTTGIDSFLTEYSLTSQEGIALMCLAEALLRVPDNVTIDSLIKDKLLDADWASHTGNTWSYEEIEDVLYYLNKSFYGFDQQRL